MSRKQYDTLDRDLVDATERVIEIMTSPAVSAYLKSKGRELLLFRRTQGGLGACMTRRMLPDAEFVLTHDAYIVRYRRVTYSPDREFMEEGKRIPYAKGVEAVADALDHELKATEFDELVISKLKRMAR